MINFHLRFSKLMNVLQSDVDVICTKDYAFYRINWWSRHQRHACLQLHHWMLLRTLLWQIKGVGVIACLVKVSLFYFATKTVAFAIPCFYVFVVFRPLATINLNWVPPGCYSILFCEILWNLSYWADNNLWIKDQESKIRHENQSWSWHLRKPVMYSVIEMEMSLEYIYSGQYAYALYQSKTTAVLNQWIPCAPLAFVSQHQHTYIIILWRTLKQ